MTRRKLTLITTLLLTLPTTPLPTTHTLLLPRAAHARSHIESVPRETDGDPESYGDSRPTSLAPETPRAELEVQRPGIADWVRGLIARVFTALGRWRVQ